MSRPFQMTCSACGRNITIAGSEICLVCTPIEDDAFEEDWEKAESAPLLCGECFRKEHGAHSPVM